MEVIKTNKCNQCKEPIYSLICEWDIPKSKYEEFSEWLKKCPLKPKKGDAN